MDCNLLSERNSGLCTFSLWFFFITLISIITIVAVMHGHERTVTLNFVAAALNWVKGHNLYHNLAGGFIYLPHAAIFYIPFTYLPFVVSEILWRVLSLGLVAWGLFLVADLINVNKRYCFWLILSLITIPLAFSSARNGQFNMILLAMMLFAVIAVARESWWGAAILLVLGFAIKPTMIVLLLLTWLLYRQLWWRVLLALLVMLLLPFLFQHYSYVMQQYSHSVAVFFCSAKLGATTFRWAQFFGLLARAGLLVTDRAQTVIRVITALLTFVVALVAKNKFAHKEFVLLLFTLAACYLMLFNPRTENNDYIILAPAIGYFLIGALSNKNYWRIVLLVFITIGLFASYYIAKLLTPGHVSWFAPLMALIFSCMVIKDIFIPRKILF